MNNQRRENAILHAVRRLRHRYGVEAGTRDIREMNQQIQARKPSAKLVMVVHQSDGKRQIWSVNFAGRDVLAVYHPEMKTVVTFMRPEFKLPGGNGNYMDAVSKMKRRKETRRLAESRRMAVIKKKAMVALEKYRNT